MNGAKGWTESLDRNPGEIASIVSSSLNLSSEFSFQVVGREKGEGRTLSDLMAGVYSEVSRHPSLLPSLSLWVVLGQDILLNQACVCGVKPQTALTLGP